MKAKKVELAEAQGTGVDKKLKMMNPKCSDALLNFLKQILVFNPSKRPSASEALKH